MFTWKVVILLLPKKGTKWFGINNCDGQFSNALHIGHITGGSVLWLMCTIPTLLHIATKTEVMLSCRWPPLAQLKLIKLHTCKGDAGVCIQSWF